MQRRSSPRQAQTANEAVVEGMCKVVGKQADKGRGLHFGRCVVCFLCYGCRCVLYDFLTFDDVYVLVGMQMRPASHGMLPCNM